MPASLHQGVADLLSSRLEFYEEWLSPTAMRDGRVSPAALSAVLSFLRREGEAYHLVSARAGEYTAEWAFADVTPFQRMLARRAPWWIRRRILSRLVATMIARTRQGCRTEVTWQGRVGAVTLVGSIFCNVREPAEGPLCDYYASALERLMELALHPVTVATERCRATGEEQCAITLTPR